MKRRRPVNVTALRTIVHGRASGLGSRPFKGKAWRIGLMGASSSKRNVTLLLAALEAILGGMR